MHNIQHRIDTAQAVRPADVIELANHYKIATAGRAIDDVKADLEDQLKKPIRIASIGPVAPIVEKISRQMGVTFDEILKLAASHGISTMTGQGRDQRERQDIINDVSRALGGRTIHIASSDGRQAGVTLGPGLPRGPDGNPRPFVPGTETA